MKNRLILGLLLLLGCHAAKAQSVYGYDNTTNKDNFGIFAGLSFSGSGPLIKRDFGSSFTAKGSLSTVPTIGGYYQKGIGSRLSVRIGFSLGVNSNVYQYSTKLDSIRPDFSPTIKKDGGSFVKAKHTTGFVMPQIDLGYIFGPIKDMYLIEIRAGVGLQTYLGKNNDSTQWSSGVAVDSKGSYKFGYNISESAQYGRPNVYGSVVTNLYAGLRWQKTTNPFLNNFALGIQACIPVSNNNAGFSTVNYAGADFKVFTSEKVYFSQFSFGIKATYAFL